MGAALGESWAGIQHQSGITAHQPRPIRLLARWGLLLSTHHPKGLPINPGPFPRDPDRDSQRLRAKSGAGLQSQGEGQEGVQSQAGGGEGP